MHERRAVGGQRRRLRGIRAWADLVRSHAGDFEREGLVQEGDERAGSTCTVRPPSPPLLRG